MWVDNYSQVQLLKLNEIFSLFLLLLLRHNIIKNVEDADGTDGPRLTSTAETRQIDSTSNFYRIWTEVRKWLLKRRAHSEETGRHFEGKNANKG